MPAAKVCSVVTMVSASQEILSVTIFSLKIVVMVLMRSIVEEKPNSLEKVISVLNHKLLFTSLDQMQLVGKPQYFKFPERNQQKYLYITMSSFIQFKAANQIAHTEWSL